MTEKKNKSVFDVLQEQTTALIQKEPANGEEARQRAEFLMVNLHFALAYAHRHLAFNERDQAEAYFDLAETAGREAFNAESVHVARFTEDARPYKLALGSILDAGKGQFARISLAEVLCRIQGINPDAMRDMYREWQAGKQDDLGE